MSGRSPNRLTFPAANGDGGRLGDVASIEELRDRPDVGRPGPPAAPLPPLLLRAAQAAELCSVSLSTWERWDAAAKIPRGRKIGGVKVWAVEDLRSWVAWGCCPRKEFEARKAAMK